MMTQSAGVYDENQYPAREKTPAGLQAIPEAIALPVSVLLAVATRLAFSKSF